MNNILWVGQRTRQKTKYGKQNLRNLKQCQISSNRSKVAPDKGSVDWHLLAQLALPLKIRAPIGTPWSNGMKKEQ